MTGLKNLYFRNITQQKYIKNVKIIDVDANVKEILNQDIKLDVKKEKRIVINTIKNINNRLYLLE